MQMGIRPESKVRRGIAGLLPLLMLCAYLPAQQGDYTFRATTEVVLVNVTVRDRDGNLVRDLKPADFTVLEDGKSQKVLSFDMENTDAIPPANVAQAAAETAPAVAAVAPSTTSAQVFKDRRLIVLLFDLTSMEPEEVERAVTAAQNYVDKQMLPADMVSIVVLSSNLQVAQDFTADKDQLKKVLQGFNTGEAAGYEAGSSGTTEGTADTGGSFTSDDTEYNIFNTDRRLQAIRAVAQKLAHVQQKKSLIYFSNGMDRTGIENQSELRAATNAAVRANMAIYTMDIRGLQAVVPGGEAQSASLRGTSAYSGASMQSAFDSNFSSQETLVTLAGDTGGRAFLDSNDFGKVFKGVQNDTSMYYMLGFHSSNPARDGKYRRITVSVNRPGLKLDYRRGYYAPADYQHSTRDDRERQLEEQLASELPATDLPVYLSAGYFRLSEGKFYVPISLVVPGSEIPFTRNSDQDKATLDVIGEVQDEKKRPLQPLRDTVKLAISTSNEVQRKNVQYNSNFILPPGKYHFKFVLRENQSGRMGSFETDFTVPDLKAAPLKMSSVFLSSQLQPDNKRSDNPLVRDGSQLIPSVTHVFASGQHLYLYYEVYDPAHAAAEKTSGNGNGNIRVLSNVAFFQGKVKAYETPLVEVQEINVQSRKAALFQLDVPLAQLKPGFYTCQVNVIDDAAGKFTFPRLALMVR
ncbi:MAG: VWA domain-containing protein [Acidobacteria bacterium]|nr:VWA domain-containing protein [Acidobacteriota bacterium]